MSLMIAIPSYDGKIHFDTCRGLTQTALFAGQHKISLALEIRPHDAFIGKARSVMCEQLLATDFQEILFIDADIGFTVADVVKICRAPADIAMGLYRLKVDGADETKLVKFPAMMTDPIERHPADPFLIKLSYGPAGFLRIRRNVLEAMVKRWPDEWYSDEQFERIHDFFPSGRAGNYFYGEDISFCNRAIECGFEIYGVQGLNLNHYGEKKWPAKWQIDIQVAAEKAA